QRAALEGDAVVGLAAGLGCGDDVGVLAALGLGAVVVEQGEHVLRPLDADGHVAVGAVDGVGLSVDDRAVGAKDGGVARGGGGAEGQREPLAVVSLVVIDEAVVHVGGGRW
ncbi:MAG: hypothetical protein IJ804_02465, partial [Prevotella sp.]|nr:hypothetical protein [Prevotella sp.]